MFTKEQLLLQFPNAPEKEINRGFSQQEKFSLTLENLKCLNPASRIVCKDRIIWDAGKIKIKGNKNESGI